MRVKLRHLIIKLTEKIAKDQALNQMACTPRTIE